MTPDPSELVSRELLELELEELLLPNNPLMPVDDELSFCKLITDTTAGLTALYTFDACEFTLTLRVLVFAVPPLFEPLGTAVELWLLMYVAPP